MENKGLYELIADNCDPEMAMDKLELMVKILKKAQAKGLEISPRAVTGLEDALGSDPEMIHYLIENPDEVDKALGG